ncbi:MAG: hypothetical protein HY704_07760 [Gemmatimonadetes bacterium]|nr:hypothetical protein [Gemmatimonadota bacterium]
MTTGLQRFAQTSAEQPRLAHPLLLERRRYEIHDHARVGAPDPSGVLDIWSPVIPDTPSQRILDIEVTAPGSWQIQHEAELGNVILHSRSAVPARSAAELHLGYVVERMPVEYRLDSELVGATATPLLFSRALSAERFVDVDDRIRALARDIVGTEKNILVPARLLYDHVTRTMAYDAAQQSWKGSTEHALVCSVGNCNDIHALFMSLTARWASPPG